MAGKIIIDFERCKGCGLCVIVCPKKCIVISKQSNKVGYFPAQPAPLALSKVEGSAVEGLNNTDCTGCCFCAIICPDTAIEVFRDSKAVTTKSSKKGKTTLIKEKT